MAKKIKTTFGDTIRWLRICEEWKETIKMERRHGATEREATDEAYERLAKRNPMLKRMNWNSIRRRCNLPNVKPYRFRR